MPPAAAAEIMSDDGGSTDGDAAAVNDAVQQAVGALEGLDPDDVDSAMYEVFAQLPCIGRTCGDVL